MSQRSKEITTTFEQIRLYRSFAPDAAVVSDVHALGRVKKENIIQGYPEKY
jgi:hypothetical protein